VTTTPADGPEPNRPDGGPLAPTAPGSTAQPLTKTQKILTGIVVGAVLIIATLGFIGSYSAVTDLAHAKGFGKFAAAFPIAVDAGIIAFLALDLLLTWRRIPYPLLRYTAWTLTAATIAFNAVVSWPDPVGVGMHAVIPILFVVSVEAARHAIGRIADITADRFMEGPPASRWFLNPIATFILWRRQRLWAIRKWDTVLELERERRIYIAKLRKEHGRWSWRRKATADQALVLSLAKDGMSVAEAIELPAREKAKRLEEQARIAREEQRAADERRREQEAYEREQKRLEEERVRQAEADRIEQERKALELEQARQEAARRQRIADAEAQAQLAEIARRAREAEAEAERRLKEEQLRHAQAVAAEQERAAAAARRRRENEEAAARAAAEKEAASRRAAEIVQRATTASASQAAASRPANATRTATSASRQPANAAANQAANAASANAASPTATSYQPASASSSNSAANGTSEAAITEVVDVYTLLKEQHGRAPSDRELGDALGISRSRAQQLRTAAINAGHTELAKPVRLAS
jgi:hypothetical protein